MLLLLYHVIAARLDSRLQSHHSFQQIASKLRKVVDLAVVDLPCFAVSGLFVDRSIQVTPLASMPNWTLLITLVQSIH